MKKIILLVLVLLQIITLSGCWNNREINDMVIALAFGIDMTEEKEIQLTVQTVIPRKLGQDGAEGNATVTYTEVGSTFFEAIRKLTTVSSHKIYIGHIQLIVFGESVAKDGIQKIIDFLERDHEFRRQAVPVVTKDMSAKELLEIGSIYEALPAVHIVNMIRNNDAVGFSRNMILLDLFEEYNSLGNHLVMGLIAKRGVDVPQHVKGLRVQGAAVFSGERLVGFLNSYETRGYLWVVDELDSLILVVPHKEDPEKLVSLETIRTQSKMDVAIIDNEILLKVVIKEEGNIGGKQGPYDQTDVAGIRYLEKEKEKLITHEVTDVFDIAQNQFKVDFFGFGTLIHKKYPQLWKEIEEDWDEIFTKCPVEIKVETKIRGTGQIFAPSSSE
ncbi:spore germination protein KC [Natronincola peptidivorans]|uniref:Spore germination protein KC n=1 Tax=Natronincola peptidivorans TaxID=426128 RepID=A0A1I0CVU3_9FIRM|nr:Ger(x)C family spore germination protein [Natronincola peptidivorans]SET23688.1 spore germination protein KC [Natronincola peptidivorans]